MLRLPETLTVDRMSYGVYYGLMRVMMSGESCDCMCTIFKTLFRGTMIATSAQLALEDPEKDCFLMIF